MQIEIFSHFLELLDAEMMIGNASEIVKGTENTRGNEIATMDTAVITTIIAADMTTETEIVIVVILITMAMIAIEIVRGRDREIRLRKRIDEIEMRRKTENGSALETNARHHLLIPSKNSCVYIFVKIS